MSILGQIQQELKSPKARKNAFGNYDYRCAEDILAAAKPLLAKYNALLTLSDEIVLIGNWIFFKSTAEFRADGEHIVTTGYARHAESKKGMDEAQISGSTSSYARKYALNGLFLIDNEQDPDSMRPDFPAASPAPSVPQAGNRPPMPPMPPKR